MTAVWSSSNSWPSGLMMGGASAENEDPEQDVVPSPEFSSL